MENDDEYGPILALGSWELWPWTDGFWLMLTRNRVVKWEWKRRATKEPTQ